MGYRVLAYSTSAEFLARLDAHTFGCLLLETDLPEGAGYKLLEELAGRSLPMPVIVITKNPNVPGVVRAYQTGLIVAFLQKSSLDELALLDAIQSALSRSAEIHVRLEHQQRVAARLNHLSPGEKDVLNLLVEGNDHAQIACQLKISRRTVENRRARIMKKCEVASFPELLRDAHAVGLSRA